MFMDNVYYILYLFILEDLLSVTFFCLHTDIFNTPAVESVLLEKIALLC